MEKAVQLQEIIGTFGLDAKVVFRKRHYVVYLKEGSGIVDILNVMEAHVALMQLENVRIVKEVRNSINRRVNCETANISKTVSAAMKQIEDIKLIDETTGINNLPDSLRDLAEVRLQNPDASLLVLGNMLNPPVGKSGVNHRLRKLAQIADELRGIKEE
jgi:DNA-binding protein WhiA